MKVLSVREEIPWLAGSESGQTSVRIAAASRLTLDPACKTKRTNKQQALADSDAACAPTVPALGSPTDQGCSEALRLLASHDVAAQPLAIVHAKFSINNASSAR
jgi:hypothetical protein